MCSVDKEKDSETLRLDLVDSNKNFIFNVSRFFCCCNIISKQEKFPLINCKSSIPPISPRRIKTKKLFNARHIFCRERLSDRLLSQHLISVFVLAGRLTFAANKLTYKFLVAFKKSLSSRRLPRLAIC